MIILVITTIVNLEQMLYHTKLGKFSLTDLDVTVTKLVVLSPSEQKRFYSQPKFNADEQTIYFAFNNDILHILDKLRTVTNKVGFLLQLGYFKSHGKFYTANQFRQQDIDYVVRLLGLNATQLDFDKYQKRQIVESIKHGSMITWQHINLQGKYDFTKHAANDTSFDLTKILALQIG